MICLHIIRTILIMLFVFLLPLMLVNKDYQNLTNYKTNFKKKKDIDDSHAYENLLSSCSQIAHKFRTRKVLTTISNLFTRQFTIELKTAKLCCLHIITIK